MGITIVQKSELGVRKHAPKIALVLAGGAITGGAFKLGGLKALDDFLVNRKINEFDTYVGLSAGAVLAAPLAAGVSPAEMLKSLEGKSEEFSKFAALDFYSPNLREFVAKPLQFAFDVAAYAPGVLLDLARQAPALLPALRSAAAAFLRAPSPEGLGNLLQPISEAVEERRGFPFFLDYLPSGFFDNASIERYLRSNFERAGISNDFRALYRNTSRELYIGAMNLDTAERVVFGHDEDTSVTVSEAVQASTALPGFYKPARLHGVDYVDGGVRRTANIDVAIEHGADLVICYNPFRPFSNRVRRKYVKELGKTVVEGRPLADTGLLTIVNQVFRTLLHSRLQYGLRQYQDDPHFRGDIIVVEPKESDLHFFQMSALAYWQRIVAAQHGYISVTQSIEQHYDLIKPILETYGIAITRRTVRQGVDRLRAEDEEQAAEVLIREVPRRNLSVA
ncbi:MAG: patatin-like phospholipase family protein [Deltaproteobacteria bacterium]|nr:patatin-like phospholipase family protein [Deltaproteobacteria bacterium]